MKAKCTYILVIFLLLVLGIFPAEGMAHQGNTKGPRNVILMIGDGMGIGQIEIARKLEYGKDGRLFLESLPHTALVHTESANNFVTDSAAGGTALAIGKKTNNEMIGVTPDGKETDSILDLFKKNGKKAGVISTNTVTDATPAAFTASVSNRWSGQEEIARQQLNNEVDVLMGGGRAYFSPEKQNGKDLINEARMKGYDYAANREEMQNAKGEKLLGLFNKGYMNFKLDRPLKNSKEPSLKEMTEKAISVLSKGKQGFFLMAEGARIDHASHAGDITSIWKETIEFDEAVKYAVEWAKKDKETLVLVAADHETMGISASEPLDIQQLKEIKATPQYMVSQFAKGENRGTYRSESVKDVLKKYANIDLNEQEIKAFNDKLVTTDSQVYPQYIAAWEIGSLIAEKYHGGILTNKVRSLSSTGGHTGNMIPLFAYGNGSETFTGVMENTDIPKRIAQLMNYSWD
ncbi:alkaline phosphatase [Cytobacillus firmus]|uniref:Alkaline phosphatase n=2 Tax=Cytobacillus TaxID=2675230 RepID=A0A366JNM8_CYTFI|nr:MULTISPECIES: alkaline phosphatase [Cytobacillus]RBP89435.1 alkaline phosphatase [Cytobacillus firmus]TDX47338.1 alkaline phosphatase [Cytobacillus oceanisediminis]